MILNINWLLSSSTSIDARVEDLSVCIMSLPNEVCTSTGMFGSLGKTGRVQAHDAMITCLDAIDTNLILSAGMDTRVLRWDFRTLANSVSVLWLLNVHNVYIIII